MRRTLFMIAALIALPAFAQEQMLEDSDLPETAQDITLENWRALAQGNSVEYVLDGEVIGREFYLRDGRTVRFELPNGMCIEGEWAHQGTTYCFAWPGSLVCARHMMDEDGRLWFPSVDASGAPTGEALQSGQIVEGGFPCAEGLTS